MGAYANYVQDFPKRCGQLIEELLPHARFKDRDITFLLAMATPALIFPLERLVPKKHTTEDGHTGERAHPSQDDTRYAEASKMLRNELEKTCRDSRLFPGISTSHWKFSEVPEVSENPYCWSWDRKDRNITEKKVSTVLKILRNALAHGNIWTMGHPIDTIVFVSLARLDNPEGSLNTLRCSPVDLATFLKRWMNLVTDLQLPANVVVEASALELLIA